MSEELQALIDELEEEYALDNLQAPAGAASNWTEDEIREYLARYSHTPSSLLRCVCCCPVTLRAMARKSPPPRPNPSSRADLPSSAPRLLLNGSTAKTWSGLARFVRVDGGAVR